MARCHHVDQDFRNDLDIELAREGDILEYGEDLSCYKNCKKNPGHSGFIPFKDLKLEDLPQEDRCTEKLETIKKWGSYVVRLVVHDEDENPKFYGSGFVFKNGNEYQIKTNNHVVKTDDAVKHCKVEFFYDGKSDVSTSRGVKLGGTCSFRDISFFSFDPVPEFVHQLDAIDQIPPRPTIVMFKNKLTVTCRSKARFKSSQPVYFTAGNLNNPQIEIMFILNDKSISYFKSSYFKFQPVPSNIQEFTSIEIRIDEDDGNSRVILGDVVKFDNEFVVKISESIFQDEVKKCRLVWNGEIISRGTRLYFQQVKSTDFFSDMSEIDFEQFVKLTAPSLWLFDFHPQPRGVEQYIEMIDNVKSTDDLMCCIGHPHGTIKMVTFGRVLGKSLQRFDNQYRRISNPGKDCNCKEVNCVHYSCKTCPGSSGSPVFLPTKVFNISNGINHFMGERVTDGELIENNNIAWG